ncbi:MAG: ActD-like protein [Gemmatimonadetes bacterium]|nr:ActD-like protein [Gemmatimonadota bacterium]
MRRRRGDWKLERFRLNELPEEEMRAVQRALDEDPNLSARLEALEESDREIHASYPTDWMARQVARRSERRGPSSILRFNPRFALAAVVLLAVVFSIYLPGPEAPPTWDRKGMDGIRLKGVKPDLLLYRKRASEVEQLADSSVAYAGDLIQIFYRAAGKPFGAIVSVDGRSTVTRHLPASGTRAVRLIQGDPVPLDYSYELDDAPEWERFYFLTADTSFDVRDVTQAAKGGPDSLQVGREFEQFAITLYKGVE